MRVHVFLFMIPQRVVYRQLFTIRVFRVGFYGRRNQINFKKKKTAVEKKSE